MHTGFANKAYRQRSAYCCNAAVKGLQYAINHLICRWSDAGEASETGVGGKNETDYDGPFGLDNGVERGFG
jgi:hypothetical protein